MHCVTTLETNRPSRIDTPQCLSINRDNDDDDDVRSDDLRTANYVCKCPGFARASNTLRVVRKRGELVERLLSRAASNASYALDELLVDYASSSSSRDNTVDFERALHPHGSLISNTTLHFVRGSRLDTDAMLVWLLDARSTGNGGGAESELVWPSQRCRACVRCANGQNKYVHAHPISAGGQFEDSSYENDDDDDDSGDDEDDDNDNGQDGDREAVTLRLLALVVQCTCALFTLPLIGVLFRLRKSRVSMQRAAMHPRQRGGG